MCLATDIRMQFAMMETYGFNWRFVLSAYSLKKDQCASLLWIALYVYIDVINTDSFVIINGIRDSELYFKCFTLSFDYKKFLKHFSPCIIKY